MWWGQSVVTLRGLIGLPIARVFKSAVWPVSGDICNFLRRMVGFWCEDGLAHFSKACLAYQFEELKSWLLTHCSNIPCFTL